MDTISNRFMGVIHRASQCSMKCGHPLGYEFRWEDKRVGAIEVYLLADPLFDPSIGVECSTSTHFVFCGRVWSV
jgi:hypothetical protein